jgi:hypothetical protein
MIRRHRWEAANDIENSALGILASLATEMFSFCKVPENPGRKVSALDAAAQTRTSKATMSNA